MALCREEVFAVTEHVGYYASPLFHYYGVLNTGDLRIVAGPTAQVMSDEQKLRELAFRLDVPREEVPVFTEGMRAIRALPVETVLQLLCMVNHFLNGGEELELSDLAITSPSRCSSKTPSKRGALRGSTSRRHRGGRSTIPLLSRRR